MQEIKNKQGKFYVYLDVGEDGFTLWAKDRKNKGTHWILDASLFFKDGHLNMANSKHYEVGLKKVGRVNKYGNQIYKIYKKKVKKPWSKKW